MLVDVALSPLQARLTLQEVNLPFRFFVFFIDASTTPEPTTTTAATTAATTTPTSSSTTGTGMSRLCILGSGT